MTQAILAAGASPEGSAPDSIINYILGFGPIGIGLLAYAFGWVEPRGSSKKAREEGRADLQAENQRLVTRAERAEARADKAEAELNDALRLTADRAVPLLEQFVSATGTLIPILQGLVRYAIPQQPGERDHSDRLR